MTTGLILTTGEDKAKVYAAISKSGFTVSKKDEVYLKHGTVDDLVVQVHGRVDSTEIEFEDWSDRFPKNPRALEVLRQLYVELPGLRYNTYDSIFKKTPNKPLSEYYDTL